MFNIWPLYDLWPFDPFDLKITFDLIVHIMVTVISLVFMFDLDTTFTL